VWSIFINGIDKNLSPFCFSSLRKKVGQLYAIYFSYGEVNVLDKLKHLWLYGLGG
jgi:hypothetical protein